MFIYQHDPEGVQEQLRDWAGTDPGRLAQLLDRERAKLGLPLDATGSEVGS